MGQVVYLSFDKPQTFRGPLNLTVAVAPLVDRFCVRFLTVIDHAVYAN